MFYKTGGRTSFQYKQVESVVMDIERHLNNRPWMYMYVENGLEEEQVLMPSDNMYGNGGRENTFMVSWRAIASGGRRETTQKSRRSYRLSEKKRTGIVEEGSCSCSKESHTIERPLNLVCSLEIRGPEVVGTVPMAQGLELRRSTRCTGHPSEVAAVITRRRLRSDADHFCDAVVSTAKLLH